MTILLRESGVIGTGTGALPVMDVKREAQRRKVKLIILTKGNQTGIRHG